MNIDMRVRKLEADRAKENSPNLPYFCMEKNDGSWEVKTADGSAVQTMTAEQMNHRPDDRVYLILANDGGIYLESGAE